MWPAVLWIGSWQITWWGLWLVIAFVLGSFIMWKQLREDYDEEEILTLSIVLTVAALIMTGVIHLLVYRRWGWWPWGGLVGGMVALSWWSVRKRWNYWECLDALGEVMLISGAGIAAGWGKSTLLLSGILILGAGVVYVLRRRRRRLWWYKSGRPGLVGLFAILWLAISQSAVAIKLPGGLYWGPLEVTRWVGGTVAVCSLAIIYWRAGYNLWPTKKITKRQ